MHCMATVKPHTYWSMEKKLIFQKSLIVLEHFVIAQIVHHQFDTLNSTWG